MKEDHVYIWYTEASSTFANHLVSEDVHAALVMMRHVSRTYINKYLERITLLAQSMSSDTIYPGKLVPDGWYKPIE